jgi:transcriptional antiterminator RfaH
MGYQGTPAGWAVAATHPHREQSALEHLGRQDFVTYCPMIRKRHSHARRVGEVLRPLFPGYVFVHLSAASPRWRPLMSTIGVRGVIRSGDAPSLLDDDFVESLKAREIDGVISRPDAPYQVGQQVRLSGSFDGITATIIALHERDRLTVLMNLLNRPVRVTVEQSQISLG